MAVANVNSNHVIATRSTKNDVTESATVGEKPSKKQAANNKPSNCKSAKKEAEQAVVTNTVCQFEEDGDTVVMEVNETAREFDSKDKPKQNVSQADETESDSEASSMEGSDSEYEAREISQYTNDSEDSNSQRTPCETPQLMPKAAKIRKKKNR